jgi:hypothetical protein
LERLSARRVLSLIRCNLDLTVVTGTPS